MKRLFARRWFQVSAGLLLLLLIALLSCAWYFRVWSLQDLHAYQEMSRECHPVWQELHWGRIHAGQEVEEVIATTRPLRIDRYGDFVRLNYQGGNGLLQCSGVTITAKNGRLACAAAWGCTWGRLFFDDLSQEDWQAFEDAWKAHILQNRKEREEADQGAALEGGR